MKKRTIRIFCTAAMLFVFILCFGITSSAQNTDFDINDDGKVNIADVTALLDHLASMRDPETCEHRFGNTVTILLPTCEGEGITRKLCPYCNKAEFGVIPALGHTPVTDEGKDPECEAAGYTEGSHCAVCEKILVPQTEIPALGHTPKKILAIPAECLKTGLTEGSVCEVCNKILTAQKETSALGHTPVTDAAVAPTCTENGKTEGSHCERCFTVFVRQQTVPALSHNYVDGVCTRCCYAFDLSGMHFRLDDNGYVLEYYEGTDADIYVPATYAGVPVVGIYDMCFARENMRSIVIAEGVTEIGYSAFSGCTDLRFAALPSTLSVIGDSAFYDCINLEQITIPEKVVSIGNSAFRNCTGLTSVVIPQNVEYIGDSAFENCTGLRELTLGEKVKSIGNGAFSCCARLRELRIPDSVLVIGDSAFCNCTGLTFLEIGNGVTKIGNNAFYACYGLVRVVLGESVSEIGEESFRGCNKLIELENHSALPVRSGNSEYGFVGQHALFLNPGESQITEENGFLFFTRIGFRFLVGYIGNETELTLPECSGENTYILFPYAFAGSQDLKTVTVPEGVESIPENAFYECSSLRTVVLPESLLIIEDHAFDSCERLVEVVNNSLLELVKGSREFGGVAFCALSIHTGESIIRNRNGFLFIKTEDGNYLIDYLGNETEPVFPENFDGEPYEIFDYAFRGKNFLLGVKLPDSVTAIGKRAFMNCSSLVLIDVGEGVNTVGTEAFYYCRNLNTAIFGRKLTKFGDDAFVFTDAYLAVYYTGTREEWELIDGVDYKKNVDLINKAIRYSYERETASY